ncbi:MAG: hypothetical protein IK137_03190 [Bacilli bacterium]|nr:hypothetical protein [Bacilli bacterium]
MKNIAKLVFTFGLIMILIGVIIVRKDSIITIYNTYFSSNNSKINITNVNEYYRDEDFSFVQNISDKVPSSYQDLLNVFYTVINSGKDTYTFYCPKNEYDGCIDDVETIANNQTLLSNINNYVHPYNQFSHIETEFDNLGKVTIYIIRPYNKSDINKINKKVDELYKELYNSDLSYEENIKTFHDYIINNTKYDANRSDNGVIEYKSDIAYGPLFEGYAICGGYTDLMQLFLEKMGLNNFRVSSYQHVWNAVEINNKWYHIDLTWDDPVMSDGSDRLNHNYMLISTKELLDSEKTQHNFDENAFIELKEAS